MSVRQSLRCRVDSSRLGYRSRSSLCPPFLFFRRAGPQVKPFVWYAAGTDSTVLNRALEVKRDWLASPIFNNEPRGSGWKTHGAFEVRPLGSPVEDHVFLGWLGAFILDEITARPVCDHNH